MCEEVAEFAIMIIMSWRIKGFDVFEFPALSPAKPCLLSPVPLSRASINIVL
jgi:hypothetical protein